MISLHLRRSRLLNRSRATCLALFVSSICIISVCGAQTAAHDVHDSKTQRINAIPFMQGKHGALLADMYLSASKEPKPGIVFLHGGAWKHGDRAQLQDVAASLAESGYVGMAIDYDLTSTGDRFPVALQEAEEAVRWLRLHAAQYGVDPKRIAVAGSSAGGELAALIGLARNLPPESSVQAAVIFNGVLDLSYVGPDSENMVAPYLGGICAQQANSCRAASPVQQVHERAVPFYVGHGTADRIVPYSQAEHFVQALTAMHVPVTSFVATGAGHTYWNAPTWYKANLAKVAVFLRTSMP